MDEVFICGPEAMIEATEKALIEAGVPESRVYTERFTSGPAQAAKIQADTDAAPLKQAAAKDIALTVVLDGKQHELHIGADEHVLDAALDAGLDLPFSCKAGVCCTCRAKVLSGEVVMDKNFTLEGDEMAQGYVLSCQARDTTRQLTVSLTSAESRGFALKHYSGGSWRRRRAGLVQVAGQTSAGQADYLGVFSLDSSVKSWIRSSNFCAAWARCAGVAMARTATVSSAAARRMACACARRAGSGGRSKRAV
jgi:2Fe-2S type ferredoxin